VTILQDYQHKYAGNISSSI